MEEKNLILRDLRTVHVNGVYLVTLDKTKLYVTPCKARECPIHISASTSAVSAAMLTNPHRIERLDSEGNAPNAITLFGEKATASCLVWTGTPRPANKYSLPL